MRETRQSGSEGGEGNLPDPYVRSQAYHIREVKVPFRDPCFRPVADRNCVIARWGGEQREANGQSVG
jgi:hypothetical protein